MTFFSFLAFRVSLCCGDRGVDSFEALDFDAGDSFEVVPPRRTTSPSSWSSSEVSDAREIAVLFAFRLVR